jgi:hypothetical protein
MARQRAAGPCCSGHGRCPKAQRRAGVPGGIFDASEPTDVARAFDVAGVLILSLSS